MSVEENKAVVRRLLDQGWNGRKMAAFDELCLPTFANHDPSTDVRDLAGLKQFAIEIVTAFPDAHVTVDEMIGEGDLVAKRWTFHGTHSGSFMGVAPTEKRVEFTGTTTYRVINGRIVDSWWNWDTMGVLKQLGAIPETATAGAR